MYPRGVRHRRFLHIGVQCVVGAREECVLLAGDKAGLTECCWTVVANEECVLAAKAETGPTGRSKPTKCCKGERLADSKIKTQGKRLQALRCR